MSGERWNQIEQLLEEALALPPDEQEAFLKESCSDGALRARMYALHEALDKHPLHSVGLLDRAPHRSAITYVQTGRPARARAFLEEYRDSIPPEIHGRHREQIQVVAPGWIAVAEGRLREGASIFERWVVREAPWRQINRRFALGLIYDRMAEPDSAIAYYERYLATPHISWIREAWWRGRVLERLGQLYEARGAAEKAVRYYTRFVEL